MNILDIDNVLIEVMSRKIEYVERIHPFSITKPNNQKGRWQTYYKENGRRKIIRSKTKENLIAKLYDLYKKQSNINCLTFEHIFYEWLDYKIPLTSSVNTIIRYRQRYKKYLATSNICHIPICKLDEMTLEKEFNRIVKEYDLSRKEWVNINTISRGMFDYSYRKRYIAENPIKNVKILVKFRQVSRKSANEQTFNTEEKTVLEQYLDCKYQESQDLSYLAIKMNLSLGLRVGELVALKWSDIVVSTNELHICKEEVRNQETGEYSIVEHTKTHTDRFVFIVPKVQEILDSIPRQSEFIFQREGKRITARQISYVLERYAQDNGLKVKSTHKIRRTYASTLAANNVPLECIREQLGHSSLLTTMGYIHNSLTKEETYNLLKKAL